MSSPCCSHSIDADSPLRLDSFYSGKLKIDNVPFVVGFHLSFSIFFNNYPVLYSVKCIVYFGDQ